jgi:hypothetical protein
MQKFENQPSQLGTRASGSPFQRALDRLLSLYGGYLRVEAVA